MISITWKTLSLWKKLWNFDIKTWEIVLDHKKNYIIFYYCWIHNINIIKKNLFKKTIMFFILEIRSNVLF